MKGERIEDWNVLRQILYVNEMEKVYKIYTISYMNVKYRNLLFYFR